MRSIKKTKGKTPNPMNLYQSIKEAKHLFGAENVTIKADDSPYYNRRTIIHANGIVIHTYYDTVITKPNPPKKKRVKPLGSVSTDPNPHKRNKRAERAIESYVIGGSFDYWTTLTFDPKIHDFCLDYDLTVEKVSNWFRNYKLRHAPDLHYLMVFELMDPDDQGREKWHVHLFLKGVNSRDVIVTRFKNNHGRFNYDFTPWSSKFGFSQLDKITTLYENDIPGLYKLASYLSKYAVKKVESALHKKRYRVTKSLCPAPIVSYSHEPQPLETLLNNPSLSYHGYYYVRNDEGAITNLAHKFIERSTNVTLPL
jgi:hypothetical protein